MKSQKYHLHSHVSFFRGRLSSLHLAPMTSENKEEDPFLAQFLSAQAGMWQGRARVTYTKALKEISAGEKRLHWLNLASLL